MSPDRIIDFDDELGQEAEHLNRSIESARQLERDGLEDRSQLASMHKELENLGRALGMEGPASLLNKEPEARVELSWDDEFFLEENQLLLESQMYREIYQNPRLLPPLTAVDYAVTGIASVIAVLIDFLIVRIPKDVNYLGKFDQKGSDFTGWLRSFGVDDKGKLKPFFQWLEKTCKVPYDKVSAPGVKGFGSRTHRMMSLGHDPLFGLVFGVIDILHGQMTVIGSDGALSVLPTDQTGLGSKFLAPVLFLGHLVSDMCTSMGVPIPGWGFTQLLQFGQLGPQGKRTVADLARYMYVQGYDLRHLVTMATSTAVIEIVVRAYHYLAYARPNEARAIGVAEPISTRELERIESNLKLHKMLFMAHTGAAAGNAMKVFAYQGNPSAINLTQWIAFLKESVTIVKGMLRDKKPEMIARNRKRIDEVWDEIRAIRLNELRSDPVLTSLYGSIISGYEK